MTNAMINTLYDNTINGTLLGHVEDNQETKVAAVRLEGFVEGATNKGRAAIINGLVADYAYQNGKQFFALGFEVAKRLFMNDGAGAING